jgi:hypothetical protein
MNRHQEKVVHPETKGQPLANRAAFVAISKYFNSCASKSLSYAIDMIPMSLMTIRDKDSWAVFWVHGDILLRREPK